MKDEGVIKFKYNWKHELPLPSELISELNVWRDKLYKAGLIGEDANGIGYGNISCRVEKNIFIITGSGTGSLEKLNEEHYTRVTAYDLSENSLTIAGPIKASSESLTHAAVYETAPLINSVFHIHHPVLWETLLFNLPSTAIGVEYGTTAMAVEIGHLLRDPVVLEQGIIAMGGHKDGILAFGTDSHRAGRIIDKWLAYV